MQLGYPLNANGNKITSLGLATAAGDALSQAAGDARYLQGGDSGWIAATYQATGIGTAAGQAPVAFRKIGQQVFGRGVLAQNSGGPIVLNNGSTPLWSLPAGYYPTAADSHFVVATSGANGDGYFWINHLTGGIIPTVGPTAGGSFWAMRFTFALD